MKTLYDKRFEQDAEWLEAWVDDYTLNILLLVKRKMGDYIVVSPGNELIIQATFQDYEEARTWLLEDEYFRIETRYTND